MGTELGLESESGSVNVNKPRGHMAFQMTLEKARSTIESRKLLTETLSTLCYFFASCYALNFDDLGLLNQQPLLCSLTGLREFEFYFVGSSCVDGPAENWSVDPSLIFLFHTYLSERIQSHWKFEWIPSRVLHYLNVWIGGRLDFLLAF